MRYIRKIVHPLKNIFSFDIPHKRAQDKIKFYKDYIGTLYTICVMDGWHNLEYLSGNKEGRQAAIYVADTFSKLFLSSSIKNYLLRAQFVADIVDQQLLHLFPKHVSCVGTFIFRYADKTILVTIGTINTFILKNNIWEKPKEIHNNELDWRTYKSGSATFFGRGELKGNIRYSNSVDVMIFTSSTSILVLTDGANGLIDLPIINELFKKQNFSLGKIFMETIMAHILLNKDVQNDDISVLLTSSS